MEKEKDTPVPIRLNKALMEKIAFAANKLGWSTQQTMREAMRVGLGQFERLKWDLTGAILDAAAKQEADEKQSSLIAQFERKDAEAHHRLNEDSPKLPKPRKGA